MELLSGLNRPPPTSAKRMAKPQVLTNWHVDGAEGQTKHAHFDEADGVFRVPRDGLYSIVVEVIPTDGTANVSDALSRRKEVSYAVRIEEPPIPANDDGDGDNDGITTEFLDVGPVSFGELIHMKTGARLSIQGLAARRESIRLKVELVQRKRKRARSPELTKKELKKMKKKNRKKRRRESSTTAASESDTGTGDSSEWDFSSDDSGKDMDDIETKPSGKQLASKLKIEH